MYIERLFLNLGREVVLGMNHKILNTYFQNSNISLEEMESKVSANFKQFLSGEKEPTYNQLLKIAKKLDIPVGLLLINRTVSKPMPELKFRTINSHYLSNPSNYLLDTISEVKEKQDFLKSQINDQLDFIGEFSIKENYLTVADSIRIKLNLEKNYYISVNKNQQFNFLRKKISKLGVFVFLNGKVKDNSQKKLDINEFRGFVLSDKKAPIIFINQQDELNGRIFTMIHELTHLFIGDNEILGIQKFNSEFDKTETFVNYVTSEILVPNENFLREYTIENTVDENIDNLAKKFKVSKFVIVRKLLDNKIISQVEYDQKTDRLLKAYEKYKKLKKLKRKTGGNYANNLRFRIDRIFINYVESALSNQQISFTDAYNIIGVNYKGYKYLTER